MLFWKLNFIFILICIQHSIQNEDDNNLANHKLSGLIQWKYEKRPFCNAFTGCGKKRAPLSYAMRKRNDLDEIRALTGNDDITQELGDLIDINAEPAVENVQKQIMSQAKIFEAIKEASKEIFRQKNRQRFNKMAEEKQAAVSAEETQPNTKIFQSI